MAKKIQVFDVILAGHENLGDKITEIVNKWLEQHGDKVAGPVAIQPDSGFRRAIVSVIYEHEEEKKDKKKD